MRSDRRRFLPYGLDGGCPGTPSWNIVNPGPGQQTVPVMPMEAIRLADGDAFCHIGAGGAGQGDPLERDPALVAADVAEERITGEYAEAVYGVVLDAAGAVDAQATDAARATLRETRENGGGGAPAYLRMFQDSLGLPGFALEGERRMIYAGDGSSRSKGG